MAVTRNREAVAPVHRSGPVSAWAGRHVASASDSLRKLLQQPIGSLMIIGVIAVTLALPAALHLVVKNALAISGGWEDALDFSVFLDETLTVEDAEGLRRLIGQRADVEAVTLITADQALKFLAGHPTDIAARGFILAGRFIDIRPQSGELDTNLAQ